MFDQEIAGEVLAGGRYGDVAAGLEHEFSLDPECASFDTLLWLLNLVGRSPRALELAVKRPPELLTGDTFFEIGAALHKCTQTELLMKLAIEWSSQSDHDYRPFALLSIGNLQAGRPELARERAEESLALNPEQPYLRSVATKSEDLLAESQDNNLVWLTRLARVYSTEENWKGVLETTNRILELAPENPVASRLKTTALDKLEGSSAAYQFSRRQFAACGWFEPFYGYHCRLCRRLWRGREFVRAIFAYSKSRDRARVLGELLVARFKPVAFVQSVAGWHDF